MDDRTRIFYDAVNQRLSKFKQLLGELVQIIADDDKPYKARIAGQMADELELFLKLCGPAYQPGWVPHIRDSLRSYVKKVDQIGSGGSLVKELIRFSPSIDGEDLSFITNGDNDLAVDFEHAFQESFEQTEARDALAALIGEIQSLILSGKVNSIIVQKALEQLLATLRAAAQKKTWASVRSSTQYVKYFVKTLFWEYLEERPSTKALVKAIRKTIEKYEAESAKAEQMTITVVQARVAELPEESRAELQTDVDAYKALNQVSAAPALPAPSNEINV